jgi:vacuolar-type H+-ATPase subunit H
MGLFGNKFEQPSTDEEVLIKRAESNVDILVEDLKDKNWTEVWDNLCHTELNSPSITAKMSPEVQEKFKNLIAETKEVFVAEKENIDKDLVDSIQEVLDRISEKL